jgi:hypothetical protein
MRPASLPLVGIALATLVLPAPAAAQRDIFSPPPDTRRVDVSASAGFLFSTDWSDLVLIGSVSPTTGAFEQVLARDLVVDPGPVYDGTVTYWEERYGLRVHLGFSQSCLAVGRRCHDLAPISPTGSGDVDLDAWQYDIGGAIGFMEYGRTSWVWPYGFVGLGAVTYNLERSVGPPLGVFIQRRPSFSPDRQVVITREDADTLLIAIDELGLETKFAVNFGIGADFRIPLGPASVGLRLEVSDHVHPSPMNVRIAEIDDFGHSQDVHLDFGLVHNIRTSAGLVVQFGR